MCGRAELITTQQTFHSVSVGYIQKSLVPHIMSKSPKARKNSGC